MKKYIIIMTLSLAALAISLTSCGTNDMSNNNGSDTGVDGRGIVGDAGRAIEDGINDMTDGSSGDVRHDAYSNDGYGMNDANSGSGMNMANNGADMSYDSNGVTGGSAMNY